MWFSVDIHIFVAQKQKIKMWKKRMRRSSSGNKQQKNEKNSEQHEYHALY